MENQQILLDMYQTAGVGVVALILGMFFTRSIPVLKRLCIPAPVSGGILISLTTLLCYSLFGIEFSFDGTLKDICMMVFFTSVGFQSNLKVLKQGGKPLIMMILLVLVLIIVQNLLSVGIASGMGLSPLVGMAAGSIPMCGGHGTAGGFSGLLESMGLQGASSITMAAATFGLVAGSIIGGPLAERLISRHNLCDEASSSEDVMVGIEASDASPESKEEVLQSSEDGFRRFTKAVYQILIAMALGTLLSKALALTGITFPTYFGSLMVAALMRNTIESTEKFKDTLCLDRIISLGNICLSLFLGMAMVSLRLWELADLALPLVTILTSQVIFIALFAYFVAYNVLGKNYDSAVLVSGLCGFGLGATPNAMANMSAVCYKYHYAVNPFVIVPIIGAMFVDIINTTVITVFLNLI
ncbi:MAG: sodium/glutamate symporter [Bacteroidales bacterium]|nr:sodium/glutamate symporter [Bacteroidales bacterium]